METSEFLNELNITDLGNENFKLHSELRYRSKLLARVLIVPEGFITDLASIPRILWPIYPPFGKYSRAAVVHDYLIRCNIVDFKLANKVFDEAMKCSGVNMFTRNLFYYTVKFFGYANNNTDKSNNNY